MVRETDYDRLEREAPELTLKNLRTLHPVFMDRLERREDLRGTYVLLQGDGDSIAYVTNYERGSFDPSTLTLEQGQILLEMPASEGAQTTLLGIDGGTRWQLRNLMEVHGDTAPILRPDGRLFEPDYSQLSAREAQELKEKYRRLPR